ncbi:putative c6 zinc finger domain-containing protein [Golovinomyces cichoracearum]|uniref:Putative c6 zinc finger domain-containing protein n=1 Tax=Golovinomyces cichoracearum TaxID=62708 RepID=A0A420ICJ5_9PEZI|nr:putative c6 zinc finger domain-containing protein [Golovinomyces cichoracearum]
MDIGQPDQKRMRLSGNHGLQWPASAERQLPLPPQQPTTAYNPHITSYPRSDSQISQPERDRRQVDHSITFESQEIRRPSSGPHTYHPLPPGPSFATPRDLITKRDSSDEIQYCHSSNGMMPDAVNSAPPQESPNRINQTVQNYDTPRPQSFTQSTFPGSAVQIPEPYSHPYGATTNLPPPPIRASESYTKAPYSGTRTIEQHVRKKAQRAAQACDCCRTAKAKCDEGRPSCTSCRENGKECRYRDPPPKQYFFIELKRQDKTSADIMDILHRLETVMKKFTQQMDHLTNEVNEIKKVQHHQIQHAYEFNAQMKREGEDNHSNSIRYAFNGPPVALESHEKFPDSSIHPSVTNGRLGIYHIPNTDIEKMNTISDEEDHASVEPGPPKQPSIPVNHTTGAARLLLVSPIKKMCADIMLHSKFKSEKYPYIQEWKRGLLRLYGRGEGNEILPCYDKELVKDHTEKMDINRNYASNLPVISDEWGQIGSPVSGITNHNFSWSGTSSEALPDFSREKVIELVDSYKKNINNMHPILTPRQLDELVESFLKSIQETRYRSEQAKSMAHDRVNCPDSPGQKRKMSPTGFNFQQGPTVPEYKPGHPFRSISAAIVLLCMALGKICQDKRKIPQIPSEQEIDESPVGSFGNSSDARIGIPTPPQNNNPIVASLGMNSPSDIVRLTGRNGGQFCEDSLRESRKEFLSKLKNIDVIPGLIYFALATDILGNQMAGSSLQHVHANILAGLFHAQLGRIMESAAYISNACRALQVILRPRLERFRRASAEQKIVQAKDNPLIFAFWTCLQLESDIVAEIPCPQTGILTFEEDMPGPNLQAAHHDDGFEENVIESYSAQLFLRKHLNSLHSMFYKPRDPNSEDKFTALVLANNKGDEPKFPSIELLSESLNGIHVYAPTMRWVVDQPDPPNDILGARLRAKYYGARVITYRPFVLQVLERSEPAYPENLQSPVEQISDEYLSEVKAPIVKHDIKAIKDIDPKALEYVRLGLKALINSTTAFHGLGHPGEKRIIVTNVWGTAHAQWGNVLTLQAAYMNPILKPLLLEEINKEELIVLVEKTMGFLALVGSPTSALAIDWKILDLTSRKNGLRSQSTLGITKFPDNTLGDILKY